MAVARTSDLRYDCLALPRRAGAEASPRALGRFSLVGIGGYGVNLLAFVALERGLGAGHLLAATGAFGVAVSNNYLWNRRWTFRATSGPAATQALRFLAVSLAGLALDLAVLHLLVDAGSPPLPAQALGVLAAVPVTFLGSKLWTFRRLPDGVAFEEVLVLPPRLQAAPRAVVCVPTFDERENLGPLVDRLAAVLGDRDVVLVVDDASPDGTGELADGIAARWDRLAVMHRPEKSGLGRAYVDGVHYALSLGAELVVTMDGDLSHAPEDVARLIAGAHDADLVIGSRYVSGGSAEGLSRPRRALSRAGSLYAAALLHLPARDLTGGFKCFRRSLLERIGLDAVTARGYAFQIETTYRAARAGAAVVEVPIAFGARAAGASKLTPGIALEALVKVPELRLEELVRAVARYGWVIRWWAISRALVLVPALAVQGVGWPRGSWYPPLTDRPLALLGAWDGRWYRMVATHGYFVVPHRQSDTAFFPLYPMALRGLHALGLSMLTGGILLANLSFLVGLVALFELTRTWLGVAEARRAVVYAALFPFGFVFSMVYPEGLVFALMALSGLLAIRDRWVGAALLAAVATLARPEGAFLALPLAVLALRRWRGLGEGKRAAALAAALAAPVALTGLAAYESRVVGDPLAFSHAQLQWGRWTSLDGPVRAFHELTHAASLGREWLYRDAALCALYVVCLALAVRAGVPLSWVAAGALMVVLPLWSGSFTSDARFGLLALPVYCGLARATRARWLDGTLRVASGSLLAVGSATILLHWP